MVITWLIFNKDIKENTYISNIIYHEVVSRKVFTVSVSHRHLQNTSIDTHNTLAKTFAVAALYFLKHHILILQFYVNHLVILVSSSVLKFTVT